MFLNTKEVLLYKNLPDTCLPVAGVLLILATFSPSNCYAMYTTGQLSFSLLFAGMSRKMFNQFSAYCIDMPGLSSIAWDADINPAKTASFSLIICHATGKVPATHPSGLNCLIVASPGNTPAVPCSMIDESADTDEWHKALRETLEGRRYVSPTLGHTGTLLSTREKEVLKLIVEEYKNAEIARALGISEHTVETHRKHIFKKTGAKSIVGLVKYAFAIHLSDYSSNPQKS